MERLAELLRWQHLLGKSSGAQRDDDALDLAHPVFHQLKLELQTLVLLVPAVDDLAELRLQDRVGLHVSDLTKQMLHVEQQSMKWETRASFRCEHRTIYA